MSRSIHGKTSPKPTRLSGAWFGFRRGLLLVRRSLEDCFRPAQKFSKGHVSFPYPVEKRSPLYRESDPAEIRLELGKVQNLRLVAKELDGIQVPARQIFSFWRHVGRCTRSKGYAKGRQLQEGCLMPAVGGGICQLTNALYSAALDAGLEVVERHPHTRAVQGAQQGRDATVAWNYIDLRLRSTRPFEIRAKLTDSELVVGIAVEARPLRTELRQAEQRDSANSCATCGRDDCGHWYDVDRSPTMGRTAWLVDVWLPEWEALLAPEGAEKALLFSPLDGGRWRKSAYAWPAGRFGMSRHCTALALRRAFKLRRLATQGSARQEALLEGAERLAKAYARRLPFDVRHLVVSQEILPFLWREGVLGGRSFDVLMSRLPMAEIHRRLDAAAERHPDRKLLSDFRAPDSLIECEHAALDAARCQFAFHRDVAASIGKPVLVDWRMPARRKWTPGKAIVFPGPTVARKGAYAVREVAGRLGLEVVLLGRDLEGPDFWSGVKVRRMDRGEDWLDRVAAVVQPAILEDRPTALLQALASGCPVIASRACGLPDLPNLTVVEADDPESLARALMPER